MNELQKFTADEFGTIRGMTVDGEPWLVGKDVAAALGYRNPRKALADHVDSDDKRIDDGVTIRDSIGRDQIATIINESGLYSLIFGSKLPNAQKFKRWVTSDVLPSIRKAGGYISGQETMTDAELMAKAILVAQRQIEQKNAQIAEMHPKALFADAVSASKSSILVGELAKLLKQNGVDIGQKRLFAWLRDNGYLIKSGSSRNMPTQKGMELGLFEIKESTHLDSNGNNIICKTVKVTGKGQVFFINKFLGKEKM